MENYSARPEDSLSQAEAYTVKEIAIKLGMKERTAYAFCEKTTDFKVKRIGRLLRIPKESFDKWWNG
jgi:excisionase family DNA binding protein